MLQGRGWSAAGQGVECCRAGGGVLQGRGWSAAGQGVGDSGVLQGRGWGIVECCRLTKRVSGL